MFMGVSPTHSSTVGNIMDLRTGNVSPQYHVVYDDLFSTVPNGETGGILDDMPINQLSWSNILESGWERVIDPVDEASSGTRFVPSLDREWLSDAELPPSVAQPVDASIPPEPPPSRSISEEDAIPAAVRDQDPLPTSAPEGPTSSSEGEIDTDPEITSSPEGGIDSAPVIDPDQSVVQQNLSPRSKYWDEDLPAKRRRKPNPKYAHPLRTTKVKLGDLNQAMLMGLDWKSCWPSWGYFSTFKGRHHCHGHTLLYLVVRLPTTIESTGFEPIYSVDFVCCVCYHYHPLVVVDFVRL
jgi:hypothetical protein